jgi:hypothetical protein
MTPQHLINKYIRIPNFEGDILYVRKWETAVLLQYRVYTDWPPRETYAFIKYNSDSEISRTFYGEEMNRYVKKTARAVSHYTSRFRSVPERHRSIKFNHV